MHFIETRMNNSNCLPMVKELLITYLLCSLAALANRSWELRDKLSHARRGHFPVPPQHVPGMSEFSYLQLANVSNASFWEKCMHIRGIHRLFFANVENPEESYVIYDIYMIWIIHDYSSNPQEILRVTRRLSSQLLHRNYFDFAWFNWCHNNPNHSSCFNLFFEGISSVNLEVNTRLASTSPVAGGSRISTLGAVKLPNGLRRKQSKVCSVGSPTTTSLYLLTERYTNKGSN